MIRRPKENLVRELTNTAKFRLEAEAIEQKIFKERYESPLSRTVNQSAVKAAVGDISREEYIKQLVAGHSRNSSVESKSNTKKIQILSKPSTELLAKLLKNAPSRANVPKCQIEKKIDKKSNVVEVRTITLNNSIGGTLQLDLNATNDKSVSMLQSPGQHKEEDQTCTDPTPANKSLFSRPTKQSAPVSVLDEFLVGGKSSSHLPENSINNPNANAVAKAESSQAKKNWFSNLISKFGAQTPVDYKVLVDLTQPISEAKEEKKPVEAENLKSQNAVPESNNVERFKIERKPAVKHTRGISHQRETRMNTTPQKTLHLRRPDLSPFTSGRNPALKTLHKKHNSVSKTVGQLNH